MNAETCPQEVELERDAERRAPPVVEEVVFVLLYDEEIACLANEGVVRPGMLPSGFKDG